MKNYILLMALTGFALSACAVKSNPAKTTVYTPTGAVEYHCPPGQAKKGRC